MTYIVDQLFPPVDWKEDDEDCIEYTSFNYWRDPLTEMELDLPGSSSPTPEHQNGSVILSKPLPTIPEN